MHKVFLGVAFAVIVTAPAAAQNYSKNFVECAREFGFQPNVGAEKLSDGRTLRKWYVHDEHQMAAFSDCLARKASQPPAPIPKGRQRAS